MLQGATVEGRALGGALCSMAGAAHLAGSQARASKSQRLATVDTLSNLLGERSRKRLYADM